eukprot:gene22721-biopygen5773
MARHSAADYIHVVPRGNVETAFMSPCTLDETGDPGKVQHGRSHFYRVSGGELCVHVHPEPKSHARVIDWYGAYCVEAPSYRRRGGMVRVGLVWAGLAGLALFWFGSVWFGHGLVWSVLVCACGAKHPFCLAPAAETTHFGFVSYELDTCSISIRVPQQNLPRNGERTTMVVSAVPPGERQYCNPPRGQFWEGERQAH